MPVYTYRREDGTTFDYRQKFTDSPLTVDPETGQHVARVIQAAGVIFKGSGFYINDSKSASRSTISTTPKNEKSDKSDGDTSTKVEKSESKAEAKPVSTEASTPAASKSAAAD
jgi:putative FmdB family regulatory protein